MNILVLGNGYLGEKIADFYNTEVCKDRIESVADVHSAISYYNADVVINCIGKTGRPNIDWCESNREETAFSNIAVPLMVSKACKATHAKHVHLSTGCMYYGVEWFTELDEPNFVQSFYSQTKYMAERSLPGETLQLRVRMPIGSDLHPRNLITKLLNYNRIIDYKNSVTVIDDSLSAMRQLINKDAQGVFNVVNPGPISPAEIINLYNEISPKKHSFSRIYPAQLDDMTLARRSNCTLSTNKLKEYGIVMRDAKEAIIDCILRMTNAKSEPVLQ